MRAKGTYTDDVALRGTKGKVCKEIWFSWPEFSISVLEKETGHGE